MTNYIPADKLIAEIERLKEPYHPYLSEFESGCKEGRNNALDDILSFITHIQQDKDTLELCSKIWWEEQGWIMIPPDATIEGIDSLLKQIKKKLQQEQPEVDLEKEIDRFWDSCIKHKNERGGNVIWSNKLEVEVLARHFYELGRKQILQEIYDGKTKPVDKITAAWLDDKEEDK